MSALLIGNKRKAPILEEGEEENPQLITNGKRVAVLTNGDAGGRSRGPEETPEFIRPAVISPAISTSQVRLAVPRVRSIVSRVIDATGHPSSNVPSATGGGGSAAGQSSTSTDDSTFEARNTRTVADKMPTRLTLTRHGQILWMDFLPKAVLLVTGNNNFWCAACEDGGLHVFSPVGRRMLSALVIESQPCFLDCRGWWLMCISSVGVAHVWSVPAFVLARL
jgi:protein HIRA/HIR1